MKVRWEPVPLEDFAEEKDFARVLEVWESGRCGRAGPEWKSVDLLRYPAALIPYFTVVEVAREPEDYVYRFWGSGHTAIKGCDLTGKSVLAYRAADIGAIIFAECREVVASRAPGAFRHSVETASRLGHVIQNTVRLPLSADGESVSHILSFADWRRDRRRWQFWLMDDADTEQTASGTPSSRGPGVRRSA